MWGGRGAKGISVKRELSPDSPPLPLDFCKLNALISASEAPLLRKERIGKR